MTTKQTIDGVPRLRELLERVATETNHMLGFTYAANYDECRAAVDELRALLDAPVAASDGVNWKAVANEQMGIIQALKASQLQGEPVAYVDYSASGGIRWRPWEHGNLADGAPLFSGPAEQPAPVAVTLSHVLTAYDYAESHPHKYLRGTSNWCAAMAYKLNACLDEATRLNTK